MTDWLKPDQTSGVTVETTAYVLLTVLIKVMSLPVPYLTQSVYQVYENYNQIHGYC